MSTLRNLLTISFLCLGLALTTSNCFAQFGANVQGSVQDKAGASIPGATVRLFDKDTNVTLVTTSGAAGDYRFNSLANGNYSVTATATGFAQSTVDFFLQANQQLSVTLSLPVASASTTVLVTTEAPLLDTAETRNQQTLEQSALQELPVGARNPTSLETLTPGVVGKGASNGSVNGPALNFNAENYVDASANGRGATGNQYIMDGLDVTSNARQGVLNMTPNVDALQEVTVQVNRYDVDFAKSSSIQTIMTTRAGTQSYHGFASTYYTFEDFYARPDFSSVNYPPFHILNSSFGGGGPILRKRKLYFFATYEPFRSITTNTAAVQSFEDPAFVAFAKQARPNSFGTEVLTKYPVSKVTVTGISDTAAQLFGASSCGTPAYDNIPCSTPVIDTGTFGATNFTHAWQWNVRIDKYWNKDRLYGTIFRGNMLSSNANVRSAFTTTSPNYTFNGQVNETHDFSAKSLNEVGWAALRMEGINSFTGTFTTPLITVTGLGSGFGDGSPHQDYVQHSYHWRDVYSHIASTHSIKVGYEGVHAIQQSFFAPNGAYPSFSYTNLINFINDNPYSETSLSYDSLTGQPSPSQNFYMVTAFGFFAEDSWQATHRLTVNYGIRYDNFGNVQPIQGTKYSAFYPGTGTDLTQRVAGGSLHVQNHYFQHDMNYIFSPRVGVALDPFGNQKYVIRGGFGLYHDFFNIGDAVSNAKTNPPSYVIPTFYNDGSTAPPILGFGTSNNYPYGYQYPKFVGQTLNAQGGIVGSQIAIGGSDPNLTPESTMIYSVTLEHQLGGSLVASAGYSGSHSYNLQTGSINPAGEGYGQDVNTYAGDLIKHINCTPGSTPGISSCSGTITRPNTSFGAITLILNGARQNYNAAIFALKGRFARNGYITASYTYSRDFDDANTYPTADLLSQYYGPSNYDIPNRVSIGGTYQFPGLRHNGDFLEKLGSGFTLSGTAALQSGQPFTVVTTTPFAATLNTATGTYSYTGASGDYNADGHNSDFPNVSRYNQAHDRASFKSGIFPQCSTGNLNNCGPFSQPAFGTEGNEISNQFRSPGYEQTDLTLEKITKIHEEIDVRLRIDAFNIFNRPNLGTVDATAGDSTFGKVISLSGPPRNLLLGLRINF